MVDKKYLFTNTNYNQITKDIAECMTSNFVVVYHDNCMDGAVSAALVVKYLQDSHNKKAILVPVKYGCDLLLITKEDYVIIVDFSFAGEKLEEMAQKCKRLLVIDHHYTATSEIKAYVDSHPITFNYYLDVDPAGKTDCGASLTNDLFYGKANTLVSLTKTHDLWYHGGDLNSGSLKLNYAFSKECNCDGSQAMVGMFTELLGDTGEVENWITRGEQFIKQDVEMMQFFVNHSGVLFIIDFKFGDNQEVSTMLTPVVGATKRYSSVLGGELARHYGVGITYHVDDDGTYEYSLRSNSQEHNVAYFAKTLGGGGHRNAAGFRSRLSPSQMFKMVDDHGPIKFDPYRKRS